MKGKEEYTGRITLNGQQSIKAPITPGKKTGGAGAKKSTDGKAKK